MDSVGEELERLARLRASGDLSDAEYELLKERLIAGDEVESALGADEPQDASGVSGEGPRTDLGEVKDPRIEELREQLIAQADDPEGMRRFLEMPQEEQDSAMEQMREQYARFVEDPEGFLKGQRSELLERKADLEAEMAASERVMDETRQELSKVAEERAAVAEELARSKAALDEARRSDDDFIHNICCGRVLGFMRSTQIADAVLHNTLKSSLKPHRKILKQEFGSNFRQIQVTPYGRAVIVGCALLDHVLSEEGMVEEQRLRGWTQKGSAWEIHCDHFSCEPAELLKSAIQLSEERLFQGVNPTVPAHPADDEHGEYSPSDMILGLYAWLRMSPPGDVNERVQAIAVQRGGVFLQHGLNFPAEPLSGLMLLAPLLTALIGEVHITNKELDWYWGKPDRPSPPTPWEWEVRYEPQL